MGCFRGTCPVSRAPIQEDAPVIGLIWAPSHGDSGPVNTNVLQERAMWTVGPIAAGRALIKQSRVLLGQEDGDDGIPELLTVSGVYDDYGWIKTGSLTGPAIPPAWLEEHRPLTLRTAPGGRNASLIHTFAAETLVGRPWEATPEWTSDLVNAAADACCELVTFEHASQTVYPEQVQARERLAAALDWGLETTRTYGQKDRKYL